MAWPEGIVRFRGTRHSSTPVCGQGNVVQPIYKSCWMPVCCCCCSTFRTQTFHSSFALFASSAAIRTINSAAFWRPLLLCVLVEILHASFSVLWNRTQCQCYWMPSGWMGIKGGVGGSTNNNNSGTFYKTIYHHHQDNWVVFLFLQWLPYSTIHWLTLCLRVTAESQKHFLLSLSKTKNKTTRNTYCGM